MGYLKNNIIPCFKVSVGMPGTQEELGKVRNVHEQQDKKYYLSFSKEAINDMSLFGSRSGRVLFRFSMRGNFALVL